LRVLYDTNLISYRWLGQSGYREPLRQLEHELDNYGATRYVSTISVQELQVCGRYLGNWDAWIEWVHARFAVVSFIEKHANAAATLQVDVGHEGRGTKAERREAKDLWYRDAALMGTAIAASFDMFATGDEGFRKYQAYFPGVIRIVEFDIQSTRR